MPPRRPSWPCSRPDSLPRHSTTGRLAMTHSAAAPDRARDANESLESLVDSLAAYHESARADTEPAIAPCEQLELMAHRELAAIREGIHDEEERGRLDHLGEWLSQDLKRLEPLLDARRGHRVASWAIAHPQRDRKSTRLNSSHVRISYAVFCL